MAIHSPPSSSPKSSALARTSTSRIVAMESNSNTKEFLQELIVEILLRVPVKSLLKFKCVSDSWCSIISDPNFAKSHFELSAVPTHKLLFYQDYKLLSIDLNALFHDHPPTVQIKVPFQPGIRGSCRGFIMLHHNPYIIIWNPSTGVHRTISHSHIVSSLEEDFDIFDEALFYGFGYDSSKDDYLVVIASEDFNSREDFLYYFSLRTNSWKKLEAGLPNSHAFSSGLFLKDALHWHTLDRSILAFDLVERSVFKIPLPVPLAKDVASYSLAVLGGCLSVSFWSDICEIWVMKEYKVQSSWTMYGVSGCYFDPIYFTEHGEIIGQDWSGRLSKYNDRGEQMKNCACCCSDQQFWMYTESLLSLPGGSGEAGENDQ